jgi:hypothetical protein
MRQLKIDLSELEMAFDQGNEMISYYVDTETGEIFSVTDDANHLLEAIYESYYDEQTQTVNWETVLQEMSIPEWQRESLQDADRIQSGIGNRYIAVPLQSSADGYRDMEAFISTVRDMHLQERLEHAISGRGAFRYFKDVLLDYPAERERWFQFKQDRNRQRMLDWLAEEGISLYG